MDEVEPLVLGTTGPVTVRFVSWDRPHHDELTIFVVEIDGPDLNARAWIESVGGDGGLVENEPTLAAATRYEDVSLSTFLNQLAASDHAWHGPKRWRSLANELQVDASCDPLGHVTLAVSIRPNRWEPSWSATAFLSYPLGELAVVGRTIAEWFVDH